MLLCITDKAAMTGAKLSEPDDAMLKGPPRQRLGPSLVVGTFRGVISTSCMEECDIWHG